MLTAKEELLLKLQEYGYANNYYFLDNKITSRLGALVNKLKKENKGFVFESYWSEQLFPSLKKNKDFIYVLVSYPSWFVPSKKGLKLANELRRKAKKSALKNYQK